MSRGVTSSVSCIDGVVDVLDRLVLQHGAPHYVRFDNGPEFVAYAVHDWCRFNGAGSLFIDLGSPWENAWIEPFNGRLRDELLNSSRFDSLLEARVISKTGAATTTPTDPTPPTANSPQPSSLYIGPRPTNPKSHSDWTTNRVPLSDLTTVLTSLGYPDTSTYTTVELASCLAMPPQ